MRTDIFTKGYDSYNEDYYRIEDICDGKRLIVLADGMGGLSLGDQAAHSVCDSLAEYVKDHIADENLWDMAFKYADDKLRELSIISHSNMGAAVTAMILSDWSYEVAWQGNVRLYNLRDGLLGQITDDHVMDNGYGKKMLTRCLKGSGQRNQIPSVILPFHQSDRLYICTDGFYNKCEIQIADGLIPSSLLSQDIAFEDDATCVMILNTSQK